MINISNRFILLIYTSKGPGVIRGYDSEDIFAKDLIGGEGSYEIPDGRDLAGTDRAEDEFDNLTISDGRRTNCQTYNLTGRPERQLCTPGSQYIIRCRICICPYMGSINNFCRPMPPEQYCEQAFPNYNYIPMGRRSENGTLVNVTLVNVTLVNVTLVNVTEIQNPIQLKFPHNHTMYRCEKPGNMTDDCFICECDSDRILVEEHCYKSDSDACTDATPTFIKAGDYPISFKKFIT